MKKILLILLLSIVYTYASVGKITSVKGEVYIQRDAKVVVAKSGTILELKDVIKTKNNAKALILFKDKTSITMGNNSSLSVNEFVMDLKNPSKSKTNFGFGKGIFRTITGKIGKINPKGFRIKTKSASIGIRGTIFTVEITPKDLVMAVQSGATWILPDNQQIPTEVLEGEVVVFDDLKASPLVMEKEAFQKIEEKSKKKDKKKSDKKKKNAGAPNLSSVDDAIESVEEANNNLTNNIDSVIQEQGIDASVVTSVYTYESMCPNGISSCDHFANFDYGYRYKDGVLNSVRIVNKATSFDQAVIDNYIIANHTAAYEGNIAAIVNGTKKVDGTIDLDFNFGAKTFTSAVVVNNVEGNIPWSVTYAGSLNRDHFFGNVTSGTTVGNSNINGNIDGNYGGVNAESVGGEFHLNAESTTVSAVFGAHVPSP